jgi:hypothetical protein
VTKVLLHTPDGRPLPVDYEHDWADGRTLYRCCKGTLALSSPDSGSLSYEHTDDIQVMYGSVGDRWGFEHHYNPREDCPEFFGIRPLGASLFTLSSMDPDHPYKWIGPRRGTGEYTSCSVPDGTRRRIAAVVATLVRHWIDLPDYATIRHVHAVLRAPVRLQGHQSTIEGLTGRIRELETERAAVMRLADVQARLAAEVMVG